jgi:hypothetical protein
MQKNSETEYISFNVVVQCYWSTALAHQHQEKAFLQRVECSSSSCGGLMCHATVIQAADVNYMTCLQSADKQCKEGGKIFSVWNWSYFSLKYHAIDTKGIKAEKQDFKANECHRISQLDINSSISKDPYNTTISTPMSYLLTKEIKR